MHEVLEEMVQEDQRWPNIHKLNRKQFVEANEARRQRIGRSAKLKLLLETPNSKLCVHRLALREEYEEKFFLCESAWHMNTFEYNRICLEV